MQGFAVNDAVVLGIDASYDLSKVILLHKDTDIDVKSSALPQSCYVSHLDLQMDVTSGSIATVDAFLSWDSAGDDPMTGASEGNVVWAGMTDTSLVCTSIALDVWVTAPAGQTTAGKCYLHLKVVGASSPVVTLNKARLNWAMRRTI